MFLLKVMLLLYGCEVARCFLRYEYHLINDFVNWTDARRFCRERYTDLLTFSDFNDYHRPSWFTDMLWIGLFDDPASWKQVMGNDANSWRWSVTGTTCPGGYQNWAPGQPDHKSGTERCGAMRNGLWSDEACDQRLPSVCFSGSVSGPKLFSLNLDPLSWDEAQTYCRQHHTDLAMVEDESENTEVAALLETELLIWTGLYRTPWRWSDGSLSPIRRWNPEKMNLLPNEDCTLEHRDRLWGGLPCSHLRRFVCQALKVRRTFVTLKLKSDLDISDPILSEKIVTELAAQLQDQGLNKFSLKWRSRPQKA